MNKFEKGLSKKKRAQEREREERIIDDEKKKLTSIKIHYLLAIQSSLSTRGE